jgi:hypothetical protein
MTPSFEEPDTSDPLAAEKLLLRNLKTLFLILSGSAVQKFGVKLQREQEILLPAADLAIWIFALESTLLRIARSLPAASTEKRGQLLALAKVIAFSATENAATAGRKGAFFIEEGDTLTMLLSGVRRFTRYDASGLLAAKRLLAEAVSSGEKYPF